MLKKITNEAEGTQAEIRVHEDGRFVVVLRDTDAGINLPMIKLFPVYVDALAYAYKIANVPMPAGSTNA